MKTIRNSKLHIAVILFALLMSVAGCNSGAGVNYEISSYHFLKNTYKGETNPSYILLRSYSSFESVFGIGMVMDADKSKLITEEKMKDHFVFSIINQGNDIHKFGIERVSLENNQLKIYYTSEVTQRNVSWWGNSNITLLIQNCDFRSALIFENGKPLNNVSIKEYK